MTRFMIATNPMTKTTIAVIHTLKPVTIFEVLDGVLVSSFSTSTDHGKLDKIRERAYHWYEAYKKFQNGKDKIEWLSEEENRWLTQEEK